VTKIRVTSFGYRHAPPPVDYLVYDVRQLVTDPALLPGIRDLTGFDDAVRQVVLSTPTLRRFLIGVLDDVYAVVERQGELDRVVTVAFGCAGGRHRSVVCALSLATALVALGLDVEVVHRDVQQPVLPPRERQDRS
jgi:RNase adapter protein RapZ